MRTLNEIIIHCAATKRDWLDGSPLNDKIAEIRRWHVQGNGWDDIGYHYVIDRDGTVGEGRPIAKSGAHTKGRNANSVGICLIGGHGSDANDNFYDHYTPKQEEALRGLIAKLQAQYPSITTISGHNQYAAKACPGFNAPRWFAHKPERTAPVQSTTIQASATQIAAAAGTAGTAIGALDGTAQIVALVFAGVIALAAIWIMKERLKKWAAGDR